MPPVTPTPNAPLPKPLRTQLENTVKAARDVAEKAGKAALAQLAVAEPKVPDYLDEPQRVLRRKLRAHARAISASSSQNNSVELQALVWEVAYEHWHRMLFARFLAENNLLMWEPGAAVSLDDCRDMVDNHPDMAMGAKSHWELAGKLAARMLPQVFKPHSPVFEISFAPEHQRELERLLANLPPEVFQGSDSLGWVYQFWQAKRKDEVNASEVKIGANELPAVTQLFTEPYMVDFLLHNSLGAWWHTRHPGQLCPVAMPYLRTLEDSSPAAGNFEGWPDHLTDFKLLDPSCGSGHFLVAAFLLLVPLRMADEGLSAMDAVDAVLADNLHGLEIDPRCVEIAVFALALAAWRYPDEDGNPLGVRPDMPAPRIACCGLKVSGSAQDWAALVPADAVNSEHLRQGLTRLHETFAQAPLLGSLLDPSKANKGDLFAADYGLLGDLLGQALATEQQLVTHEARESHLELALSAQGLLEASHLLDSRYHLVITNVPYLALRKQEDELASYIKNNYRNSQQNLGIVFIERLFDILDESGVAAYVSPQDWLFLDIYKDLRVQFLQEHDFLFLCKLGMKAFTTPMWDMNILLSIFSKNHTKGNIFSGLDISMYPSPIEKSIAIENVAVNRLNQVDQFFNPDSRIVFESLGATKNLGEYANALMGISTGDGIRFHKSFWEIPISGPDWEFVQGTVGETCYFGGRSDAIFWQKEKGEIFKLAESVKHLNHSAQNWQRGRDAWGRFGVVISQMGDLSPTLYSGDIYDCNCCAVILDNEENIPALWAYAESGELHQRVRELNQALKVPPKTLLKIAFDIEKWGSIATEKYPDGLPKPYSDDPTQWLFHGHPVPAIDPLQVAVARLLGFVWPAELDANMELSDEAHTWISRSKLLASHVDDDGIVCLQAVRGEQPAHERLLALLIDAWETATPGSWTPSVLDKLLAQADNAGKGLAVWLRDSFFEQHVKRFQHRPFIWHVWDGQKDGFGALVNVHKLDAKNLERLIHTYLGDWIRVQEAGVASGADGAPLRLSAAQNLKARLQTILEGEKPYDIFVRWKSLDQQPIGWNPDLNDGIRLNIRPFMTAEVLRINKKPKLNITWDKDRGKDVESAPWFKVFNGERINDHHLTLAEKKAEREKTNG